MLRLNKDGFTIEVKTDNPVDEWLTLIDEMLDLLQQERSSNHNDRYIALGFIREMLPDNSNELSKVMKILDKKSA
jgi:hypothetical protein